MKSWGYNRLKPNLEEFPETNPRLISSVIVIWFPNKCVEAPEDIGDHNSQEEHRYLSAEVIVIFG